MACLIGPDLARVRPTGAIGDSPDVFPDPPAAEVAEHGKGAEGLCSYFGQQVPLRHFNDKLGSYWATFLIQVIGQFLLRLALVLFMGATNEWNPIVLASGFAVAVAMLYVSAVDACTPYGPRNKHLLVRCHYNASPARRSFNIRMCVPLVDDKLRCTRVLAAYACNLLFQGTFRSVHVCAHKWAPSKRQIAALDEPDL